MDNNSKIILPKSNKLISFPKSIDKPLFIKTNVLKLKKKSNKLSYDEILNINKENINNYSNYLSEIVYSEELYYNSKHISYDELIDYINLNEPFGKDKYKNFKYSNYKYDNNIYFSSNFESGNLRMAIKHSNNEYDLIIRPETNSTQNFQWFFFLVELTKPIKSKQYIIKFNIINLCKKNLLFNEKIRILSYYNNYWSRDTFNINLYENSLPNYNVEYDYNENDYYNEKSFYTLTFSFDFSKIETNNKYVFFSYCYPYTYSKLTNFIFSLNTKKYIRYEEIGKTMLGNSIYMIIITNFKDSLEIMSKKKCILLTGRVHPGESNSSYVIQGLIENLLSNDVLIDKLRKNFIFKIIPMLNPDGVILGNYRCNLNGYDLNRMWIDYNVEISPSNFYVHEIIKKTIEDRDIYLYCDFHGHSAKQNFFLYCCNNNNNDEELNFINLFNRESIYFDKKNCYNKISPFKISTARAVMKNYYGINLSFCLESSLTSYKLPNGSIYPFNIESYKKIGKDFVIAIYKLTNSKLFNSDNKVIYSDKKDNFLKISKKKSKTVFLPPIMHHKANYSISLINTNNY